MLVSIGYGVRACLGFQTGVRGFRQEAGTWSMVDSKKNSSISIPQKFFQMDLIDFIKPRWGSTIWAPTLILFISCVVLSILRVINIDLKILIIAIISADISIVSIFVIEYLINRNTWFYKIDTIDKIQSILNNIKLDNINFFEFYPMDDSIMILKINGIKTHWSEYSWINVHGIAIKFENKPSNECLRDVLAIIQKGSNP